ncbi:hypothetical protein OJ997_36255, partial [Solirubrobacter phytolaccae]
MAIATPASAGTLDVPNACFWSLNSTWQTQNIDLTGTSTPNPLAPGSGLTLTGASAHSRLPDWVGPTGAGAGILKPGPNELPTKVWLALAADNTAQAVQVLVLDTVARTTVTDNGDGTYSATPIDVTLPLPDTSWTAGGVGTVGFRQGGAGTLPPIPAGRGGAMITPKGSVFISVTTSVGVPLQIDCQPGNPSADRYSVVPATAGAFESVPVQSGASAVPAPKPQPAVAVRSTSLKAAGRTVKVALSCTAADCKGAVTLKAGSTSLAAKKTYSL